MKQQATLLASTLPIEVQDRIEVLHKEKNIAGKKHWPWDKKKDVLLWDFVNVPKTLDQETKILVLQNIEFQPGAKKYFQMNAKQFHSNPYLCPFPAGSS